jgi:hypothetical protein
VCFFPHPPALYSKCAYTRVTWQTEELDTGAASAAASAAPAAAPTDDALLSLATDRHWLAQSYNKHSTAFEVVPITTYNLQHRFGALGACPVVPGGWSHPTGWWGHPNHRRLPREVPGTRGPTTARHIRCLRGMCEARGRSPPRRHCTPAPRATTHWARLVRRAVPRAAPRAPGLASRKLIYSDPDLTPVPV